MDYIVELKAQLKKAQEDEAYFRNHHSIYTNEQVDNWRRDLEQWQMKAIGGGRPTKMPSRDSSWPRPSSREGPTRPSIED